MRALLTTIAALALSGLAAPVMAQAANNGAPEVSVLRPSPNTLVFDAGPDGQHFVVSGSANGAPVRVLVDTGAALVVLTPSDARAAGIDPSALVYNKAMRTANGTVPAATTALCELRVGGIDRRCAIRKAPQSVLGMSFLSRLKSFEMRQDRLTLSW